MRTGIAAADDSILPVGSVVNVATDNPRYNGVYTIMDTGPRVQGRLLDLYMWSCHEALAFGRKSIQVTVLRLGWNPQASTPGLIDRLFRRRERARVDVPPPRLRRRSRSNRPSRPRPMVGRMRLRHHRHCTNRLRFLLIRLLRRLPFLDVHAAARRTVASEP